MEWGCSGCRGCWLASPESDRMTVMLLLLCMSQCCRLEMFWLSLLLAGPEANRTVVVLLLLCALWCRGLGDVGVVAVVGWH